MSCLVAIQRSEISKLRHFHPHFPQSPKVLILKSRLMFYAEISDTEIDKEIVKNYLLQVRVNSAPSRHGITARLLQHYADSLISLLRLIFSSSLKASKHHAAWLKALISPIFMKGYKFSPLNYQPISLLSTVAKVLKRILCEHIIRFAPEQQVDAWIHT